MNLILIIYYYKFAIISISLYFLPQNIYLIIYNKIQVHLFDINIPGGVCFKESDALAAGNTLNTFQLGKFKIGLGICYDIRFAEMATLYRKQGLLII